MGTNDHGQRRTGDDRPALRGTVARVSGERGARLRALLIVLGLLAVVPTAPAVSYDAEVETAQRRLGAQGFDPGPVDGLMGRRTRAALIAFQRARDLEPSGALDRPTRAALGIGGAEATRVEPSSPAAPASEQATATRGVQPEPAVPDEPETVASAPDVSRPETAAPPEPPRPAGGAGDRMLSYADLGWRGPQGGPAVRARFDDEGGSPDMGRYAGELIVPGPEAIYVLERDARVPGLDCDPGVGRISVELILGRGGPVSVRSLDGDGYCRLGFGVVLEVGQRLEMVGTWWGDEEYPGGTVRVGRDGLVYLSP